ncbi:MAG: MFS transporter [Firmicutes bacterium]|nr:MFS transporter [Bacillota bacterium]
MAQTVAHSERDENLLARLDRIPLTKTVIGILILLSFVWLAEAFDIGIVGPVITVLKTSWHLSSGQVALLGVSSTLGVVIGMIPAGIIADRYGRRKVALLGIGAFSVLTILGAFVTGLDQLAAVRFLAGIGEGAILPMPYLFLSEFVHTKRRAVTVGYANGILTAAYLIPNLAGAWAIHAFAADISWRIPFLLGAIPLLLLIPLAIWMPESPRFLLKRGRQDEVRRLVEHLEDEAKLAHDTTLVNRRVMTVIHKGAHHTPTLRTLLRPPYLNRALVTISQLTGALILFYILLVYGPTILMSRGLGSDSAIIDTALMMGTAGIGSIVQGYLADRFGRRSILTIYYLLAAIGCGLFGLFSTPILTLIAGFLTAFFGLGVFPVAKISVAEQFPTRLRGEGVYFSEMTARVLSGVVTLSFIPYALAAFGNDAIFEGIAIALLVLALPVVLFGRETAHMSVEEAGTDLRFDALDSELSVPEASAPTR